MRKMLFTIASLIVLCISAQTPLKIQQIESLDEIKLYYDSVNNYIQLLIMPFESKAVFNEVDSLWIRSSYYYNDDEISEGIWNSIPVKTKVGDEYIYLGSRYVHQPDTCYYKFLSKYYLNPESDLQDSLSTYTERMKNEGLNSLSVGTLQEFKNNHPALVDRLLKNDSIGFDVRKQPRKFVEFISFPVEY